MLVRPGRLLSRGVAGGSSITPATSTYADTQSLSGSGVGPWTGTLGIGDAVDDEYVGIVIAGIQQGGVGGVISAITLEGASIIAGHLATRSGGSDGSNNA